jgi:hypothetical protein
VVADIASTEQPAERGSLMDSGLAAEPATQGGEVVADGPSYRGVVGIAQAGTPHDDDVQATTEMHLAECLPDDAFDPIAIDCSWQRFSGNRKAEPRRDVVRVAALAAPACSNVKEAIRAARRLREDLPKRVRLE